MPAQAAPDGLGEPWSGGAPPPPSRNPGAIGRALAELRADPARSNPLIARAAGTSEASVRRARAALQDAGVIPAVPVTARRPRAYPSTSGHSVVLPREVALGGLCVQPRTLAKVGYIWVSDSEADIQLARRICRTCSVQQLCRDWSLELPWSTFGIYGDTDRAQRRRLRTGKAAAA